MRAEMSLLNGKVFSLAVEKMLPPARETLDAGDLWVSL
jgi:hypothetical protein